ncbi:MAG: hypothetical protein GX306_13645, partial [Clostridiales bacterium]|jgi:hypothetical protein|nr:hypothetical protein [Clostridiales bacterium]
MAKFERTMNGQFDAVVRQLEDDIINSAASMNLVDKSDYITNDTKVAVRVYDQYFMRNSSRASLNVTIIGQGDHIFISAIGAGGGTGIIFNFNWGAEDDMVDVVRRSVERMIN